jgi:transposase
MSKIDGRKIAHDTLEHLRLLAVRRVVEGGEAPSEVMRSLGLCRTSIYPWLRRHVRKGEAGLRARKSAGPQRKLTDSQRRKVRGWMVGKDPRQYGFEFGLWTRQIVAALIAEKFGITLGLTAVGRVAGELGNHPAEALAAGLRTRSRGRRPMGQPGLPATAPAGAHRGRNDLLSR